MRAFSRSPDRISILKLFVLAVVATQLLFVAAQLGSMALARQVWLADLANFIRLHLLIIAIGLFALGMVLPSRATRAGAVLALAAGALPYLLLPPQAAYLGGQPFSLVSANVLIDNRDPVRFLSLPEVASADILVLQEVHPEWQDQALARGLWAYDSSRHLYSANDMKLFSRFPIVSEAVVSPESRDTGGRHARRFELSMGTGSLILYAVHTQTPRHPSMWRERSAYLRDLQAALLAEPADAAVVVAGDWNTPTFSPFLHELLEATGYRTTEPRWWPLPTRFMVRFGSFTQLGVPIDRVVLSPNVGLEDIRTGPNFGSNHVPVYTRLSVP